MKKPILKNINRLDSIPLLSSSLKRLIQIEDDSSLSTHELSTIILDDYGLINKVLQTVNAFYYNRLGKEINTVTQAVVLLGFNTVKKIALSMSVLELVGKKGNEITISEIGKAFLSAHLAQAIGSEQQGMEPEEIFICTLFRHLPRIALAIGNPELLSETEKLEASPVREERLKARKIIRTLGYKLSRYWELPKTLAGYMEGCSSISGSSTPSYRTLARDVSSLVNAWSRQESGDELTALGEKIVKNYSINTESLNSMLNRAAEETERTMPAFKNTVAYGSVSTDLKGSHNLNHECEEGTDAVLESSLEREMLFTELVQNLMGAVNHMDTGLDQIYLLAIEILRRVINTGNIIFCKVSLDRQRFFASFGMGDHAGLLRRRLSFELGTCPRRLRDAFQLEKEIVLKWKELLDSLDGIPTGLLSRSILVTPLVVEGRGIGCLILDKDTGKGFEPGEIQKTSIIRHLVVTATSLRARKK